MATQTLKRDVVIIGSGPAGLTAAIYSARASLKPLVIDAPRGKGHILLFANNPMWRQNTQGSYALVTNAIMNWDHLR